MFTPGIESIHKALLKRLDKGGWEQLNEVEDIKKWIASQEEESGSVFRCSLNQRASGAKYPTLLHYSLAYNSDNGRNTKFKKRNLLVRYLMREHPGLYKQTTKSPKELLPACYEDANEDDNGTDDYRGDEEEDDDEEDEQTPLHLALTRAIKIDKKKSEPTPDPFLQLFIDENPEETAEQINSWHADNEGHSLHDVLPRIYTPDTVGLQCILKLLPHLSSELLGSKDKKGNTVLHFVSKHTLSFTDDKDNQLRSQFLDNIMNIIERCPEAIKITNSALESPYLYRVKCKQQNSLGMDEYDPITLYLKKRCILNQPNQVIQLLHGCGPASIQRMLFVIPIKHFGDFNFTHR